MPLPDLVLQVHDHGELAHIQCASIGLVFIKIRNDNVVEAVLFFCNANFLVFKLQRDVSIAPLTM